MNDMPLQNPPSIPTLAVAQLICFLRNTRLIIDWHNFGWTILALKLGPSHPLVKLAKRYNSSPPVFLIPPYPFLSPL
jgi:beta-1,4-mannosyltransferase